MNVKTNSHEAFPNILLVQGGVCAIGDLGLAVRFSQDSNSLDMPENSKVANLHRLFET